MTDEEKERAKEAIEVVCKYCSDSGVYIDCDICTVTKIENELNQETNNKEK